MIITAVMITGEQVHVVSRQFYFQRIPEEEGEPKTIRGSRDEVATRPFAEPDTDDGDSKIHGQRDPPFQVYCDYEAQLDEDGVQSPIVLCTELESDDEDHKESFYGSDCKEPFLEWFKSLAVR